MTSAMVIFLLALRRAFAPDEKPSTRRFFLGAVLLVMGESSGALWRLLWRMAGGGEDLDWMLTNDFVGFLIWMQIVGGFLMIAGPAASSASDDPQASERTAWRRVLITAVLCIAVT